MQIDNTNFTSIGFFREIDGTALRLISLLNYGFKQSIKSIIIPRDDPKDIINHAF